ncbi:MAG TPA: shikimate dehydrogenase [Armatimonadetes bacterium]|nr:shikimate dehydrogenase [Armatimonadota bacterium]
MREILGTTQVLGVIGYPVRHSFSPPMHNAALEALDLDFCYVAFEVEPVRLSAAIEGMKALGIVGLNVTIPHKETLLSLVDEIGEEARLIGALNTLYFDGQRLYGDNTDGRGFVASLRAGGEDPQGKQVVVLGAGGSARAVTVALARAGAKEIVLANRTQVRAERLAEMLNTRLRPGVARVVQWQSAQLQYELGRADLIVNTTSVGMHPQEEACPVADLPPLLPEALVYDIIYNPLETVFLRRAMAQGARTMNGVEMLVYQGALSFQLWTGREPPIEVMREALLRELQVRQKRG